MTAPAIGSDVAFSFDFSGEPFAIDARLSLGADAALRVALDARRTTPRRKAAAALDAACRVLAELSPVYANALCQPLAALLVELREMDAGRAPGAITLPRETTTRRGDGIEAIERQARIVLAYGWLQRIGVRPREASRMTSAVAGVTFKQVEDWARYFQRAEAGRRAEVLRDAWYELEVERGIDIDSATREEVCSWLVGHPAPANRR